MKVFTNPQGTWTIECTPEQLEAMRSKPVFCAHCNETHDPRFITLRCAVAQGLVPE